MGIKLANINLCSGCAACVSVCPTKSITMIEDEEGFLQPYIDGESCIACHKCEITCPIITPIKIPTDFETQAYAAINKDEEVRMRSSSGGMFHALAKWTIEQGGVVFGARFNDQWEVVHGYTETIEGIEPFMRSKYVQSRIGDNFSLAKNFLNCGRKVLFVGTPCQIGGLKSYLKKDYDNLISIDIICHGVPSPKVWRDYLKEKVNGDKVLDINFRDKRNGWKNFQCVTTTTTTTTCEKQMENVYFRGFLNNVYLRRSCYNCKFKSVIRCSDITLADFWGVDKLNPRMDDDKGTSLLIIHSQKGVDLVHGIQSNFMLPYRNLKDIEQYNISMTHSMVMPRRRKDFFRAFSKSKSFRYASRFIDRDRLYIRLIRKVCRILEINK